MLNHYLTVIFNYNNNIGVGLAGRF